MITISVLIAIVGLALVLLGSSVRVIAQYERGVVFRFGRVRPQTRGPGLAVIAPIADRLRKVNIETCRGASAGRPAAQRSAGGWPRRPPRPTARRRFAPARGR